MVPSQLKCPSLKFAHRTTFEPLDHALGKLNKYDWLILTSANTVRAMVERANALGLVFSSVNSPKIAAVGSALPTEARKAGISVALIPESYVGESLVESLAGQVAGKKFLLARATVARDVIPDTLRTAGATVDVVEAYQNRMPAQAPEQLRLALSAGVDAVNVYKFIERVASCRSCPCCGT